MKHRYQSFTRIGRQFQSLERQVYVDWTSVPFPLCQRSCLIWRTMANNDQYNDEYLCRDFFVGFNFWSVSTFGRFQLLVEVIIPEIRISSSLDLAHGAHNTRDILYGCSSKQFFNFTFFLILLLILLNNSTFFSHWFNY